MKDDEKKKKEIEDLQKRFEDVKNQAAQGQIALEQQQNNVGESLKGFSKNRGGNQPSRQSRTSTFFQELAKTSMLGGRKVDSISMTPMSQPGRGAQMKGQNSVEMQKVLI